jgi:Mg2+-importing ATPase
MESLTSGQIARETTPGALSFSLDTAQAATLSTDEVLRKLGTSEQGLDPDEAARRLAAVGPNALRAHGARLWSVLARQFRSYLLLLLLAAAAVSIFVGEGTNAGIILTIVGLSVVLGFLNEYRSERAVETLHSQIHRRAFAPAHEHRVSPQATMHHHVH